MPRLRSGLDSALSVVGDVRRSGEVCCSPEFFRMPGSDVNDQFEREENINLVPLGLLPLSVGDMLEEVIAVRPAMVR